MLSVPVYARSSLNIKMLYYILQNSPLFILLTLQQVGGNKHALLWLSEKTCPYCKIVTSSAFWSLILLFSPMKAKWTHVLLMLNSDFHLAGRGCEAFPENIVIYMYII